MTLVFLDYREYWIFSRGFNGQYRGSIDSLGEIPGWAYLESLSHKTTDSKHVWHVSKYMLGTSANDPAETYVVIGPSELAGEYRQGKVGYYNHKGLIEKPLSPVVIWLGGGHIYFNTLERTADFYGSSYELGKAIFRPDMLVAVGQEFQKLDHVFLYDQQLVVPNSSKKPTLPPSEPTTEELERKRRIRGLYPRNP